MTRQALPVLNCDACGACCEHVGAPPGWLFDNAGAADAERAGRPLRQWPLTAWAQSLPAEALESLLTYHEALSAAPPGTSDRYDQGLPCLWYDTATRRCRFYAHRPDVCQEFEVGEEDCLRLRGEQDEVTHARQRGDVHATLSAELAGAP